MAKKILSAITILILSFCFIANASAVVTLPDPTSTFDGIPLASHYDDFYTYPASLMLEFGYPAADWDVVTGTGGLDVLITSGAGGQDNDPVGISPNLFSMQDPLDQPGGAETFSGIWGNGGSSVNGPVLVDTVLDYLRDTFNPNATTPVFNFDLNEPNGQGQNFLNVTGKVSIVNPSDNSEVAFWSFDNVIDHVYDPTAWVLAPNELDIAGTSSTVYEIRNNTGSGRLDYVVYAPTMDLTQYDGQGYLFTTHINFDDLDGGFEELYLSGAFSPQNTIPEPTTLSLLGLGLLGLAFNKKRRKIA